MDLIEVNLNKLSDLKCLFWITDDESVLVAKISGRYPEGSKGNKEGIFLFAQLATHYFVFHPAALVLDLRELEYAWGNTLLRSFNLFTEVGQNEQEKIQTVMVVVSEKNRAAISSLLKTTVNSNVIIEEDFASALSRATAATQ